MSFLAVEKIYVFLFFILSLSFTALIAFYPDALDLLGFILIFSSIICLSRIFWLIIDKMSNKDTSLPDKLLSSLETDTRKDKENILNRVFFVDYSLWMIGVFLFILWISFCTLYPNEITAIKTLYFEFSHFFYDFYNQKEFVDQSFIAKIMPYVVMIISFFLICFLQMSLTASRSFVRLNIIVFLPLFLIGVVFLYLMVGRVTFFPWPDAYFLVGGGVGISKILFLIHPDMAADSASFFMARFLDTGFIGAYGLYVLLLPPLSMFFYVLTVKRRRKTLAWVGMLVIALLVMVDMFWLYHPYGNAVILMGWLVVMVCWGHLGFKTPHLRR
ncbi:MAG: hypothetical protein CMH31_02930 [Micavibrio sp.]|nr:hypothetical protein [Micavibrio sp.]